MPLPGGVPGAYDAGSIADALRLWATSEPMRALAEASGWEWPRDGSDTLALLDRLAELSADWDFRGNRERNFIEGAPAEVNGRRMPDALVIAAARALGLVDASGTADRRFSHLAVLSGLVRACVNRIHRAAELMEAGMPAGSVVVLSAHRRLGGAEPQQAEAAGLGNLSDEAEVAVAVARREFALGAPLSAEQSQPPPDPAAPVTWNAAFARYRWPSVEVIIAPSSEPRARRANTADQLRYWARVSGLGSEHDILILTTQIYVPYQHLEAVRVLGLEHGCGVYACGVDAASSLLPGRKFGGRDYLQEIRSALCSAPALLRAAREGGGAAVKARRQD